MIEKDHDSNRDGDRLTALFREAPPPTGLNEAQLRRVWRRLHGAKQQRRSPWLRWAAVPAVLLLSSGVFAARGPIVHSVRQLLAPAPAPPPDCDVPARRRPPQPRQARWSEARLYPTPSCQPTR